MKLNSAQIRPLLASANFRQLFLEELGWDKHTATLPVACEGRVFNLVAVAEKRGMVAWQCPSPVGVQLPDSVVRRKVERAVAKANREHLIVFTAADGKTQVWQWVRREQGKPDACREHEFRVDQDGTSLIQKLGEIAFSFEEEEELTLLHVTRRVHAGLNVEKVTKKFYDEFRKEHAEFLKHIEGIKQEGDRDWYASVMLNRLMFVYFIQKKGFLDGDPKYLRNRLAKCKAQFGKDKFYSFYRTFLLELFHKGLGGKERPDDVKALLGNIPYLNGGIFDVHGIERNYADIQIGDHAFERILDMFDGWEWHLDARPLRDDKEVNPDVLGYIFEKYINQKQMGAYYTKEDITEYICKNTILPFVLDSTRKKCAIAFENAGGPTVWDALKRDPDRYIYEAVRKGVDLVLPAEIEAGVAVVAQRGGWNRPAATEFALPSEIWREVVARRQRCAALRAKLSAGNVREVNDLITLNLDIRQFAQDVIDDCDGPHLLRALWSAVEKVTVLDPTCGSGAFLFAALNILEPLYEACLDRMAAFVADAERSGDPKRVRDVADLYDVLTEVGRHPSRKYFVYKSIILNNLFGVDIMDEAVEICKLRLFLKLAAQVEPNDGKENLGIEPLPDIDFNIRSGNTLVGYATAAEVKTSMTEGKAGQQRMVFGEDETAFSRFEGKLKGVDAMFSDFRREQTHGGGEKVARAKAEVLGKLLELDEELNRLLGTEYGIKVADKVAFEKWKASHRPFHWFVEFYGILSGGGFDVVVGNPPYVEVSQANQQAFRRSSPRTISTGNLYAYTIERTYTVIRKDGRTAMVVPLSLSFSADFEPLRALLLAQRMVFWLSHYDNIPDRLFTGSKDSENTSKHNQQRITIFLCGPGKQPAVHSTWLMRWHSSEREQLFLDADAANTTSIATQKGFPKVGAALGVQLLGAFARSPTTVGKTRRRHGTFRLVVPKTASYYIAAYDTAMDRSQQETLYFGSQDDADLALLGLNSNLFFWLWRVIGDSFHVTLAFLDACPLPARLDDKGRALLVRLRMAMAECVVYKGYRGMQIPNVNLNKRLDLLLEIDEWLLAAVAPGIAVPPEFFIRGKSSWLRRLLIAHVSGVSTTAAVALGLHDQPASAEACE